MTGVMILLLEVQNCDALPRPMYRIAEPDVWKCTFLGMRIALRNACDLGAILMSVTTCPE